MRPSAGKRTAGPGGTLPGNNSKGSDRLVQLGNSYSFWNSTCSSKKYYAKEGRKEGGKEGGKGLDPCAHPEVAERNPSPGDLRV